MHHRLPLPRSLSHFGTTWLASCLAFIALFAAACGTTKSPAEELYDAFVTYYTKPDAWNKSVGSRSLRVREQVWVELDRTRRRMEDARLAYARSCDPLGDPEGGACRLLSELNEVLAALQGVELGLRNGQGTQGTIEHMLNSGAARAHPEKRQGTAKRMRAYFFAPAEGSLAAAR